MGSMVSRVELLDGEIVDSDELDTVVDEILGAIGREEGVILDEILLRQQRRIAGAEQNPRLAAQIPGAELSGTNRAHSVRELQQQSGSDETLERNFVYALPIVEEMPGGVGVGAGVRAEFYGRHVGAGAFGDGLLQLDVDFGISRIDQSAGPDRNRDVVDAAHGRIESNCRARSTTAGSS